MSIQSVLFKIGGIDCPSCANTITQSLKAVDGVSEASVDSLNGTARVEYDPHSVTAQTISKAVEALGYTVAVPGIKRCVLSVEGLCCSEEERTIRTTFAKHPWIHDTVFNTAAGRVTVEHSGSDSEIISILRCAGFPAVPETQKDPPKRSWVRTHESTLSTAVSGISATIALVLTWTGTPPTALIPLFVFSIIIGGWRIAMKGWKSAVVMTFDMNFLMTIAVVGATAIGKWTEAAFVVFLFSFAQLIEVYSMRRSRKAIQSLLELSPPEACVLRNDQEVKVPVGTIGLHETIRIRPGERLPLDGRVVRGSTTIDQSPITGESLPVRKQSGDTVYAGTINRNGTIEVRVTAISSDTTLSHIIHLVEKAQEQRAPSQQLVDRFSRYYSPSVLALSVATVVVPTLLFAQPFSVWFYRGLVLLVIACPCALVISTPVSIVSALTRAARDGILIKGGSYLEEAGRIKAFAFDKTGTLTHGSPCVSEVVRVDSFDENNVLSIAAAIESKSEHPIARTIVASANERGLPVDAGAISEFTAIPGRGVSALVNGSVYYLGNHALAEEFAFCSIALESVINRMEGEGKGIVVLGRPDKAIGVIAISDMQRDEGRKAISDLKRQGIEHVAMLTGDNQTAANKIGAALGIDEVYAELLPQQKVDRVVELKQRFGIVAMVGDGINDAPALAASSVGIAMGAIGSDVAIETADIALMSDDLSKLPALLHLSRRTLRIITQNIALSVLIKIVFLALAIGGLSTLWMAIAADEGASLVVIANGLRLLRREK